MLSPIDRMQKLSEELDQNSTAYLDTIQRMNLLYSLDGEGKAPRELADDVIRVLQTFYVTAFAEAFNLSVSANPYWTLESDRTLAMTGLMAYVLAEKACLTPLGVSELVEIVHELRDQIKEEGVDRAYS